MLRLHLGVTELPYSGKVAATPADHFAALKRGKPLSKSAARASLTTGDVAEILEARYDVLRVFFDSHADKIAAAYASAMRGSLENALLGAPAQSNEALLAPAMSEIETMFKRFLSGGMIEYLGVPGTPTAAALHGVSHRFKHPYAKRARRPSFIDTGLYESSFKAWVES